MTHAPDIPARRLEGARGLVTRARRPVGAATLDAWLALKEAQGKPISRARLARLIAAPDEHPIAARNAFLAASAREQGLNPVDLLRRAAAEGINAAVGRIIAIREGRRTDGDDAA